MKVFTILISCCLLFVSAGCSDSSKKDETEPEDVVYELESMIGTGGGQLEITNPDSPLFSIKIDIPPGALEEGKNITISSPALPSDLPLNYLAAGNVIELGPDGTSFQLPVDIYLPFNDTDGDGIVDGTYLSELEVGILFYNSSTGEWEEIEISDIDVNNNTVKASVDHFSIYLVYIDPINEGDEDDPVIETPILPGEYFIGEPGFFDGKLIEKGCINRTGYRCADPYHLTVSYFNGITPKAVIDKLPTEYTGPEVTIDEDGTSATFDASKFFRKVLKSGSASAWTWECEFDNHTHLSHFDAYDDEVNDTIDADKRIYSSIEVLESGDVKISWGFDIYKYFVVKDQIVIAFEAYYK